MAGFGWWVRGEHGWRSWLSVAGAALGFLPLCCKGEWLAAVVAGVCGLLVVGAWAWGTGSRRNVGIAVGAGLVALLVAVFAVSQWPRGLISPPMDDWLAGWLLIGVGCLAALVVDWIGHASNGLVRIGTTTMGTRPLAVAVTTIVTALLVLICCAIAVVLGDNDGALRFAARDSEVLPLPSTLRLMSVDHCADGGSSGNCTAEFVVAAADDAGRAVAVARLVDHLRDLGWPLLLNDSAYAGCREIGGILSWTPHCLWLYVDADPTSARSPTDPEAVIVYIDNVG